MDNASTKQKLIVQIVCLLLSIGLWFYVTSTENPVLTNDINRVPVEILNADSLKDRNLIMAPNQTFYVNLKIEGLSQDLRKVKREDFKVQVDLSDYALKKEINTLAVNVVDYPAKINIKNSSTLSIKINIEEYVVKEIPVKSNIEIIAKPNYYVAPAIFNPTTVKVSGPSSLVQRVDSVVARGQEENVAETIIKGYSIEARDIDGNSIQGIELSEKSVEATIKVNQGRLVPIKVNTTGVLKEGLKLISMELEKKEVEISGPQQLLDTIQEISTEVVDLSKIEDNLTLELPIVIPDGISVSSIDKIVKVNVKVQKSISREYSVGFNIVGVKEGLKVVPKSDTIKVKVFGFEEELNNLSIDNIKVELNVSQNTEPGSYSETPKVNIVGVDESTTAEVLEKIEYDLVAEAAIE